MNRPSVALLLGLLLVGMPAAATAAENPAEAEAERFFESNVRPLLVERCFKCHSETKSKGGLRLDSRAAVLQGGETGAAIVVGKPDESLLVEAVRHQNGLAMPPDGKLSEVQIADARRVDQNRGDLAGSGDCRGNRGGPGDEFDRADTAERRRAGEGACSFGCGPIRCRSAMESRFTPGPTRAVTLATSR